MDHQSPEEELWSLIQQIPVGKVAAYGEVGQAMTAPVSGWLVGRMMARCPEGVPWWRVVARTGRLPIEKRDPRLGFLQVHRLAEEGVEVIDQVIEMDRFRYTF